MLPCLKMTEKTWTTTWMFSCAYSAKLTPGENKETNKQLIRGNHVSLNVSPGEKTGCWAWHYHNSGEIQFWTLEPRYIWRRKPPWPPQTTLSWGLFLLLFSHLNLFKAVAKEGRRSKDENLQFSEVPQVEDLAQLEKKIVSSFHVPPPSSYPCLAM